MTNSIELQMLSEDTANQTKTKLNTTSLMRASVLKHNKKTWEALNVYFSNKLQFERKLY